MKEHNAKLCPLPARYLFSSFLNPEDGGRIFNRNVIELLPDYIPEDASFCTMFRTIMAGLRPQIQGCSTLEPRIWHMFTVMSLDHFVPIFMAKQFPQHFCLHHQGTEAA
jgi:hypothetical protein